MWTLRVQIVDSNGQQYYWWLKFKSVTLFDSFCSPNCILLIKDGAKPGLLMTVTVASKPDVTPTVTNIMFNIRRLRSWSCVLWVFGLNFNVVFKSATGTFVQNEKF